MKRPERYSCTYTAEEEQLIEDYAGSSSIETIAKKLGRPPSGVRLKMIQMGCGDFHKEAGTYTANSLANALGISYETVYRWIRTKNLHATKRSRMTGVSRKHMQYHIRPEDFWNWAKTHKHLVDCSRFGPHDIPPEPDWVAAKREEDKRKPKRQRIWTTGEDKRLLQLYYDGVTQPQIARKLGRTLNSIERRLYRIKNNKLAQ